MGRLRANRLASQGPGRKYSRWTRPPWTQGRGLRTELTNRRWMLRRRGFASKIYRGCLICDSDYSKPMCRRQVLRLSSPSEWKSLPISACTKSLACNSSRCIQHWDHLHQWSIGVNLKKTLSILSSDRTDWGLSQKVFTQSKPLALAPMTALNNLSNIFPSY